MTVYLQCKNDEFLNENIYSAYVGFKNKGYIIKKFENLPDLNQKKEDIICGGIQTVKKSLEKIGICPPKDIEIPSELQPFLGRNIYNSTLEHIHNKFINNENISLFIKPKKHKLFNGHCINNFSDLFYTMSFDMKEEIIVSDYLEILSEYRCFILNKKIIGCKNYNGDFTLFPNFNVINNCLYKYKTSLVSYSLDFGITKNNETILIEINDSYSLGSYGLSSKKYTDMIEARWNQIILKEMKEEEIK